MFGEWENTGYGDIRRCQLAVNHFWALDVSSELLTLPSAI